MTYDPHVPSALKTSQEWFGSIISRAIDTESRIQPLAPSGRPIEEEACTYIKPSPTLRPAQRIQIYNQQYWWRLLNVLHEVFPLVVRLFGYYEFNQQLGIPYLLRFPPNHWSLNALGGRFPGFLEEAYHADDRALVVDAARLDCAFNDSFLAASSEPVTLENLPVAGDPASLFDKVLYLPKHLHFFEFKYDLLTLREELLKESVDQWLEADFPPLKKEKQYYFIVYRNFKNLIQWSEMTHAEWALLRQFEQGVTVEAACEWLETQETAVQEAASQHLAEWFQGWIVKRWLTLARQSP
jgi:hypothetical protein